MEELPVRAGAHLVYHSWLQVHEDTARHVLPRTCLTEKRIECVVTTTDCLVTRHLAIGLDAMLQAEELPAGISDLNARLPDMDADALTHCCHGSPLASAGCSRLA